MTNKVLVLLRWEYYEATRDVTNGFKWWDSVEATGNSINIVLEENVSNNNPQRTEHQTTTILQMQQLTMKQEQQPIHAPTRDLV
jgi:hypothetical protein